MNRLEEFAADLGTLAYQFSICITVPPVTA